MALFHSSAKPSHYNKDAEHYDALNQENSKIINQTIENFLRKYGVKTVLDLTCGTGSQVFWLIKCGYKVIGCDFNSNMLKIAKDKAKKDGLNIKFLKGDVRTTKIGKFGAVITIFNAVGHLTKDDFEKAMQNIHENLNDSGLYLFDIFNLSYLLNNNHIADLTIDWPKVDNNKKVRKIQFSTIDTDGILASYTTLVEQDSKKPKLSRSTQTLQVYSAKQLKEMLKKNGFMILEQCGIDGSKFSESKTDRIFTIAKKC